MATRHLTRRIARELDKNELSDHGFVIGRIGFALELYFLGGEKLGIVIHAGDEPQLGDNNRGIVLSCWIIIAVSHKP